MTATPPFMVRLSVEHRDMLRTVMADYELRSEADAIRILLVDYKVRHYPEFDRDLEGGA